MSNKYHNNMQNQIVSERDKFIAFLRLFRIFETSMISGTVIMALILLGSTSFSDFLLISSAIWFAGAGISSWNDSLDVNEDKISHPDRPISSGKITVSIAQKLGTIFALFSLVISYLISLQAVMLVLANVIIGISYSLTTKRFILLKNLTVILSGIFVLVALPFVFNLDIDSDYSYFIVSISLLLFSYEVLKDIHDIEGDSKVGINTIAIKTSPKSAAILSGSLFMTSCLIMAYSFAKLKYYPESIISVLTTFIIFIPIRHLIKDPTPKNSEIMRYVIVGLILFALSFVGGLILLRNLDI
ncbi:MAG: Digeranylgeranylglyceryl phosphate synthase [Candidatus Heimdallarchaeota archaeon LC_2]|nr:MAG: Digeranylgeranylglyceryl phosphate synthase [Candidatus Heimdallarchaeota archaeon LC_2]